MWVHWTSLHKPFFTTCQNFSDIHFPALLKMDSFQYAAPYFVLASKAAMKIFTWSQVFELKKEQNFTQWKMNRD